jgi:sodium-dependent dicarboxylate transporter 2/3/5
MLTIAYASNIGGIATLIGTPPNVVMRGLIQEAYGYEVGFLNWMLLCTPLAILLLLIMYFVMVYWIYPNRLGKQSASAELIQSELDKLGPMTRPEKFVLGIFLLTAVLWITREYINDLFIYLHWIVKLDDTIIALFATFLLFFIPVNTKEDKFLLEWPDTSRLAWGILLLFGGGLCLADALEDAGLIRLAGENIAAISGDREVVMLVLLTLFAIFLSELMSNVALVTVFVPVVIGVAEAMHVDPLYFAIPVTLGASTAFMLPMGTPPNAIVFASGKIRVAQMAKIGFVMNMISALLISVFVYFLLRLVMPPVIL